MNIPNNGDYESYESNRVNITKSWELSYQNKSKQLINVVKLELCLDHMMVNMKM